ncbi:MAG: V-type ATP synthase subunit E family protein [Porticoccus sp.]
MKNNHKDQIETSTGVEALIAKLRDDGIKQGQEEAARLVYEAQKRADWILNQAQEEAQKLHSDAEKNAEALRSGTLNALHQAARDTALNLQDELLSNFGSEIQRLVSETIQTPGVLQHLLQSLVVQACRNAGVKLEGDVEILFPETSENEIDKDELNTLVLEVSHEMFSQGVELTLGRHKQHGLRLRLKDQGMDIDLSENSLSDLLLEHLQPKFRDLLQGVSH